MTKPLLAILLLLPLSVSAGELDGRGITCRNTSNSAGELHWYEFKDNFVNKFYVYTQGTSAKVKTVEQGVYSLRPSIITWYGSTMRHDLNRKSLQLNVRSAYGSGSNEQWDCELAESLEAFKQSIELFMLHRQNSINEEMKDNVI